MGEGGRGMSILSIGIDFATMQLRHGVWYEPGSESARVIFNAESEAPVPVETPIGNEFLSKACGVVVLECSPATRRDPSGLLQLFQGPTRR